MVDGVAPPIVERHRHWFHRRSPIKEPCRVATTANVTISTALNVGDTIDGVTLADGDRVLVKNQSTGSQNGIYNAGATPARAYDVSTDDPAFGYLVVVLEGTANAGTVWRNTNTAAPTIGTTAIAYSQVGAGGVTSVGLTVPAEFSVSGSPVTGSGTLAVTKATESANTVWAGPTSGAAAAPTFRALVADDIPAGVGGQYRQWLFSASGGTLTILTAVDGTPLVGLFDLE